VLPFRVFDTHIRYLDPATGQVVQIENPTLHHRNEVLTGIADLWLLGRVAIRVPAATVSARLGTTVPLGSTVPDPFVLGAMGIPHEHTQFGTGTFEPIAGLEGYGMLRGVTLDAYALTVQSLYANDLGYKSGNRYLVGLGAASDLGAQSWRFRTTLERLSETAESWHGTVYTSEGNIGRTDVLVGFEATYRIAEDWHAALAVKIPVYTHVVGGQLDVPVYVSLTIGTHVHLWKPRAEGARGDWAGLDERELARGGQLVPLAPVPGRITVFDFWADWCVPCVALDRELAQVARRHPEDVAVRKIEVVDTDSPAWAAYLAPGGFQLPHVKLYGRDGKLVWERSGSPAALAAAVEDAIAGPPAPAAPVADDSPRVAIDVTDAGYTPARVTIPRGQRVVLVFTRRSESTCAVDVHFTLPDGTKVDRRLPLGQPVEIALKIDRAVEIPYACGMNMVHGTIVVQ
jgi:thiol-disulfide isomerase/thioredoxin